MGTVAKKGNGKKRRKIVVQIGAVIIILFTLITLAVGNMVTMASFSTALSGNISMFGDYLNALSDELDDYKATTWFIDYWRDNTEELVKDKAALQKRERIGDILKKLSRESVRDVTAEDAESLSEEEQKRFACRCYYDYMQILERYTDEDQNYLIIIAMTKHEGEDPVVLLTNITYDGDILFGEEGDIKEFQQVAANTDEATKAEVWKWAFSTPEKLMVFGTSIPFYAYKGTSDIQIFGVLPAEKVYDDMLFTDYIRNEVIVMMLVVLILILICLYFIVPRPLAKVKRCVSEYSDTKDTNELVSKLAAIRSKNEIGAFADEFSSLALEMDRYTKEIEKLAGERERVETELNVATSIQMQMLPQVFPESERFEVYASSEAAKEVGGDFYDCYMPDDDHLALTIADVSGKGVPAALFMAVSKTMLKNRTMVGGTPAAILRDVNNWLCEGNDSCMFVTVWLGILTVSTGELICANAGHEKPAIRSGDEPFRLIDREHGLSLGVIKDTGYEDEHYKLSSGDALFVYTDGVPEAHSGDDSMFGEDRLEAVLSQVSKDETPEEILQRVSREVSGFSTGTAQYDDLTMLCLVMN